MSYELAEKFLDQAEELVETGGRGESLLEALECAEKLTPEDVSVLCRSARLLFRYGVLNSKGRFFLLALDKLKLASEKNSLFFDSRYVWWQLWGNILIQLGKLVNDASLFEMALEKYERASQVAGSIDPEVYWDWAEAWILLGQTSGELTDLQQGLAKFDVADQQGILSPFFRLDYAHALCLYGQLIGDPSHLDAAMARLKGVIAETYPNQADEPSIVYLAASRKIAMTAKIRYQLSHQLEHFDEADKLLREAILTSPRNRELWLDWGEHFLYAGWIRRDFKLVETGLEKLTASSVKECDPVRVSYLLGIGLITFGLFLENLKLLKEGNERIQNALEVAPQYADLRFAEGFADLGFGLYFSDTGALAKAAVRFEEQIQERTDSVDNWYALFQTYMSWGLQEEDPSLVRKGLNAIKRVCELRPYSSVHLNERGVALLRMRQLEENKESVQICVEEAIALFQRAWDLAEEEETLYNWGCAYDLLGDITGDEEHYGRGIDLLSKALDKKPSLLHVRYHLGLALSHLGELVLNADCLAQAIEFLETVAKIESDDENVWSDLGYALLNLAQAIHDPNNPQEGESRQREAEKALLRAAELGSGDACYHLACLYSLTGIHEAAFQYLHKADVADALPSLEDLEHDDWLDGIRHTQAFRDFLTLRGDNG
ncbi:hypothetical protein ACFLR2_01190 [Chlamydiota bacterium]